MEQLFHFDMLFFQRERIQLKLERENFEREKSIFEKEISLKYQFDKKALEDEWHCKLGQHVEDAILAERNKVYDLLQRCIDLIGKIENKAGSVNIVK